MRCCLLPLCLLTTLARPAAAQVSEVQVIPLAATGLAFDSVHKMIVAEVGHDGIGPTANSITLIDPSSGKLGASVFVGDRPGAMTLSAGSRYVYVAVNDGIAVQRVDLVPALKAGPLYAMPAKPAHALAPLTGRPEGFVALRGNRNEYNDSLAAFIDGKLEGPEAGCGPQMAMGIRPSRLFTFQNQISSWDFDGYEVTDAGAARISHTAAVLVGNVGLVGTINGLIVADNGSLNDPELQKTTGNLDFGASFGSFQPYFGFNRGGGAFLPDPVTGKVFCIRGHGRDGQEMASCGAQTFQPSLPVLILSGVEGGASSPIRIGPDRFAYIVGKSVVLFHLTGEKALGAVNLAVTRSGLPTKLPPSGDLTYRLTIVNHGPQTATNVLLSDVLPSDSDVASDRSSQGNVNVADGILRAQLGALAAGGHAIVDVNVHFKQARDEAHFTAVVRAREPDTNPEDNVARTELVSEKAVAVPVVPAKPALVGTWRSLTEDVTGAGVNLQVSIVGSFTVHNAGKGPLAPFHLRFYLSAGAAFDKAQDVLLQQATIPALKPGETYTAALRAPLDVGEDGSGLYAFALLDPENTVGDAASKTSVGKQIP
jgi:uncharacterized repeat protein (TIGR01451 family)